MRVNTLKRVSFGPYTLEGLYPGCWYEVSIHKSIH